MALGYLPIKNARQMKLLPVHVAYNLKCEVTEKSNAKYDLYGFIKKPSQLVE